MKQDFVYHALPRPSRPARGTRPRAAVASSTAVSEYVAYIVTLSIAVVIAIITFAYAANITVKWLDAAMKPAFLNSMSSAPTVTPTAMSNKLAMLPASVPLNVKDDVMASNF